MPDGRAVDLIAIADPLDFVPGGRGAYAELKLPAIAKLIIPSASSWRTRSSQPHGSRRSRARRIWPPLWPFVHIQMHARSFRGVLHHREGSFVPLG
jgi:hypothetical protein